MDLDPASIYKTSLEQHAREIKWLIIQMNNSNVEIELLSQSVRKQSLVSVDKDKEISILRQKLSELQVKHECKSKELQKAMEKLSKTTPRNVS